jgi:hypothetical protein
MKFLLLKLLLVFLNLVLYSPCFVSIVAIFVTRVAGGERPMWDAPATRVVKNATTERRRQSHGDEPNKMFSKQNH